MSNLKETPSFSTVEMTSNGVSSQPEGSVTITISDPESSIRTSIEQENPASVSEIAEVEASDSDESETESVKNMLSDIQKSVNSVFDEENTTTVIFTPTFLVENKSLYQPRFVSIGPCHYGLPSLQYYEGVKCGYLKTLLNGEDVASSKLMVRCIKCVKNLEGWAKRCYERNVGLSRNKFVQVLLYDCVFIITVVCCDEHNDVMKILFRDLLLLENQVPLSVVKEVWNLTRENSPLEESDDNVRKGIDDFASFLQHSLFWKDGLSEDESLVNSADHLLDLYYGWNVPIPPRVSNRKESSWFKSWICRPMKARNKVNVSSIPSASELYEAGIKFKKKATPLNIFDVSFENGVLQIPTLMIDSIKMSLMANLLSHEKYGVDPDQTKYVACYVFLMDSLINTKEDVAILQKFDVLINKLASDDEAAMFINSLGEACGITKFDASKNFYAPVIEDIMDYIVSSWRRNWTSLKHTYFSNPWTGVSVIAGSGLLVLTVMQTVYTIYPYYHPN